MAAVGAEISLDIAKLKTGLEQARAEIKSFKGKAQSEGKGVGESMGKGIAEGLKAGDIFGSIKGSLLGAFGAGSGVLGFGAFLKSIGEEAHEIRNTARLLGESTDSVQRLQKVSKLAGLDVEAVAKGLLKLEGAMGDKENIKATEALNNLGVSAEKLAGAKLEDKILMLSGAFKEARKNGTGVHDIIELMNKSGVQMAKIFTQDADKLEEFFKKAVISDADLLKMEELNEKWDKLIGKMKLAGKNAAIGSTDFLSDFGALIQAGMGGTMSFFMGQGYGAGAKTILDDHFGQVHTEENAAKDKLEQERKDREAGKEAQANAQEQFKLDKEAAEIEKLRLELAKATEKAAWDALTPKQQLFSTLEKIAALEQEIQLASITGKGGADVIKMQIEQQKLKDQSISLSKTVNSEMEADGKRNADASKRAVESGLKALEDYQKGIETDLRKSNGPGYDDLRKIGGTLSGVNYSNPQSDRTQQLIEINKRVAAEITLMKEAVITLSNKSDVMEVSGF